MSKTTSGSQAEGDAHASRVKSEWHILCTPARQTQPCNHCGAGGAGGKRNEQQRRYACVAGIVVPARLASVDCTKHHLCIWNNMPGVFTMHWSRMRSGIAINSGQRVVCRTEIKVRNSHTMKLESARSRSCNTPAVLHEESCKTRFLCGMQAWQAPGRAVVFALP
jgi:hypothetical protein